MTEQKKQPRNKWEKPTVKEVILEWDKDVIASCKTTSAGKASPDDPGCKTDHNTHCN